MRIWKKIILGFISVTAIMVVVDINALNSNIRIIRQVDNLELSKRSELIQSYRVSYLVQLIVSDIRELILESMNKKRVEETSYAYDNIGLSIPKLKDALGKLNEAVKMDSKESDNTPLLYNHEEHQQNSLDQLNHLVPVFVVLVEQILTTHDAGGVEEIDAIFENKAEPIFRNIQRQTDLLVVGAEEEIAWALRKLNERVQEAVRHGIFLAGFSLLLALGVGWYISNSISNPVMKLVQSAKEFGKGNLDATADLNTKGELQLLANSFNQMASDIKSKVESINEVNKDLSESNQTKDMFFSIIAHDLRNPFNAILGYCYLLIGDYENLDDAKRRHYISEIDRSSRITLELLENLLNWARSQSNKIEITKEVTRIFDLANGCIESHALFLKAKNLSLLNYIPTSLELVIDQTTIGIVFNNLLSNAIKFTPKGGAITLDAVRFKDKIEISVHDTGLGMDKETLQKLFQGEGTPSTMGTQNESGTGLGLLLVKDFLERNDARLEVKSKLGGGSTFTAVFPV